MSKHEESNTISIGSCPTCGGLAQFIEGGMVRHVDLRATIEAETEARVLENAAKHIDVPYTRAGHEFATAVRSLSTKNLPTANEKLSSAKLADGWRLVPAGRLSNDQILAWAERHDVSRSPLELRDMVGDARTIQASPDTDLSVSGEVIGGDRSPKGWTLVPIKHDGRAGPTNEMARAFWEGFQEANEKHGFYESFYAGYNAMIEVAPKPGGSR